MIKIQPKRPIGAIANDFISMAKDTRKGKILLKFDQQLSQKLPAVQQEFLQFLYSKLDEILIGDPDKLSQIIEEAKTYPAFQRNTKKLKASLEKIFDYELFSKKQSQKGWNAYWLAAQFGVDTCPYCNRLYTHTVSNEKKDIIRPQFDHFWDKATYPFLAVSLYNLIPSCNVCNSNLKGKAKFSTDTHLHPYLHGFDNEVRFFLNIHDLSFFAGNIQAGTIDFLFSDEQSTIAQKAQNNIRDFKLRELYAQHLDYVHEQVNRSLVYSPEYLDSLFKQFEGTLFRSQSDLMRFITASYIDDSDLQKRPLSKLTKDIAQQFGLEG